VGRHARMGVEDGPIRKASARRQRSHRAGSSSAPATEREKAVAFLESSDKITKLAEALKTRPSLFWDPTVCRFIQHMREVRREWGPYDSLAEDAHNALRQLVEAVASGLLGGKWSLTPQPGRPGRKPSSPEDIDFGLLDESRALMEALRKEKLRKRNSESEAQRASRVAGIVERIWDRSTLSCESEPSEADKPETIDDLLNRRLSHKTVPLPPPRAVLEWVTNAYKQSRDEGRAVRSQLVWKMLAHRYGLKENQVRYQVDTASRWEKKPM
jgi:hypothetical protein